jgi:dihydrofolate synthase/folylpolyglutamate synthase
MLATLLMHEGFRVGHYSSPHIVAFNERVWIDGREADDETLERAHGKLMGWLKPETARSLSYFEYTTLLALVAFEGVDYTVLEAGLGGEFDATNVVPKILSVVTPIGIDHQAFLGETIEEIAATKLRSIDRRALLARQRDERVYRTAEEIASRKGAELFRAEAVVDAACRKRLERVAASLGWPRYLVDNAETAAAAFRLLRGRSPDEAIYGKVRLKGRFEKVAPNVVLDVGHNPLGAQAVAEALDGKKRILVYNALNDKDVEEILKILEPVVARVEIIPIESERAMDPERLRRVARRIGLDVGTFRRIDPAENYLVFGSFVVAEAFLKRLGHPREA